MRIRQAKAVKGRLALPGDKSISHRAAILSAMADGTSAIRNYAPGADFLSTLGALAAFGVSVAVDEQGVRIGGRGKTGFRQPAGPVECGNSGTTMRLLAGAAAGQEVSCELTGDASLNDRPMRRIIEPLSEMGASVGSSDGRPPLAIRGRNPLASISHRPEVTSAQAKSAVLIAGLNAEGRTTVTESAVSDRVPGSRDHTERILRYLGADVTGEIAGAKDGFQHTVSVDGGSRLLRAVFDIPGDPSSAAFFAVAAAALEGSEIEFEGLCLNPTRTEFLDLLEEAGASVRREVTAVICNEPVGNVSVRGGLEASGAVVIEGRRTAALIDEIPILAVLGTCLEGGLVVRDAGELRNKETDRISAVVRNLRSLGADAEEYEDGFAVARSRLRGGEARSFGDHRIAMAFAVAGLLAEGETALVNHGCASISYPAFFEDLSAVIEWRS